jgi:hypothetical protein
VADLPDITEVKRLALTHGDVLVITCPGRLSIMQAGMVKAYVRQQTGWPRVLILDSGMDVAALTPDGQLHTSAPG